MDDLERAFRAGYHCQWVKDEQKYIFDPLMKPGDPEGAYNAWRNSEDANDIGFAGGIYVGTIYDWVDRAFAAELKLDELKRREKDIIE